MLNPAVSLSSRSAGASTTPAPAAPQPPGAPPFAQFLNEGIHANGPDPDKAASHGGGLQVTPEDEAAAAAESQGPSDTVTAQVRAARALAQRQRAAQTAQTGQPGLDRATDAKSAEAGLSAADGATDADAATKASDSRAQDAAADAPEPAPTGSATDPRLLAQAPALPAGKTAVSAADKADAGDKALRKVHLASVTEQAQLPPDSKAEAREATEAAPQLAGRTPREVKAAQVTSDAPTTADSASPAADTKARSTSARHPAALASSRAAAGQAANQAANQAAIQAAASDARASGPAGARDSQGPTFEQLLAMPARGNLAESGTGPFRIDAASTPLAGFATAAVEARPAAAAVDTSPALQAPLHSAAFAPELAERVTLLAVDGVQTAQLELNPAEMGPVQIDIVVDAGRAEITFQAAQADTRQALERALPELAGALREQGLTLAGGGVFQQSQSGGQSAHGGEDSQRSPGSGPGVRGATSRSSPDAIDVATAALSRRGLTPPRGLLDTFA